MTAEVYRAAGKLLAQGQARRASPTRAATGRPSTTNEEALALAVARHRGGRLRAGRRHGDLARHRRVRLRQGRPLPPRPRGPRARHRRHDRDAARLARRATRSSRSRTRSPRTTRPASSRSPKPRRRLQSSATTTSSPMPARVRHAAEVGACNAALIKPNQAGTLTETKAALDAARAAGFGTIVSARSGETEDVSIVASRRRLGRGAAEGRLLHPLRAHGEVERGPPHRRGARRAPPACRRYTWGSSHNRAGIDPSTQIGRAGPDVRVCHQDNRSPQFAIKTTVAPLDRTRGRLLPPPAISV